MKTPHVQEPSPAAAQEAPAAPSRGSLAVIFLTVFIDLLGFAMVLPLLPVYARTFADDESGLLTGTLMASFSAMQFLFAPLWGRWSDRVGRRPVLLVGLAGAAVFYAVFGVATMLQSVTWLFIARIGAGIACATIPVAQAYIADTTTLQTRAKGMALIGAAFGIGFCFGPLIGAAAIAFSPPDSVGESPWPGFVAAGLSGLAFVLALVRLPESLSAGSQSASRKLLDMAAWSDAFGTPSIPALLLASFVSVMSFGGFETTLSLLLKSQFGYTLATLLLFFAYIGVVLTIAQGVIVRRLSGRLAEGTMATIGAVFSCVGFALLVPAATQSNLALLMVASGIEVLGFAFMTPSIQSLLSRRSDPARQGSIAGVSQSVSALARIAGPLVAIPLFARSPVVPYVASAAMMLAAILVLHLAVRSGKDFPASVDTAEKSLPPASH